MLWLHSEEQQYLEHKNFPTLEKSNQELRGAREEVGEEEGEGT